MYNNIGSPCLPSRVVSTVEKQIYIYEETYSDTTVVRSPVRILVATISFCFKTILCHCAKNEMTAMTTQAKMV